MEDSMMYKRVPATIVYPIAKHRVSIDLFISLRNQKSCSMVDWSSPDIVAWKIEATNIQQGFYEKLGDRIWDYIKKDERWALEKKVGYALFGDPSICCDDEKSLGYTKDERDEIYRICNLVYEKSGTDDLYVAFLFIIGKIHENKFCIPVIKVRDVSKEVVFIDSLGRVYKDWSDFKANNKLPKSLLCYPLGGTYQSVDEYEVLLEFSTSPACEVGAKVCNVLDKVTSGVGLVATGVGLVGLVVPIIAPVIVASSIGLAASGAYGLVRGSQHLHDRSIHDQTISPVDSEARNCWISILGGAFGIGSAVAVGRAAALAASGGLLGTTSECIINFLNFGSLTVNGLGIVNGLAYLVERQQKGQLTPLDVFQWSASVFFFFNAAVNIKTANGIVKDVQEGIKSNFAADLSKRRMKAWKKINRAEGGTMEGNARLIKGISNIGSKDEFFRLVIKGQTKFDRGINFSEGGFLISKGQVFFDTKAGIDYPINYKEGGNFFNAPDVNARCVLRLCQETTKLMNEVKSEMERSYIRIDENLRFELNDELVSKISQVFFRYCDSRQDDSKKKKEMHSMLDQAEKLAQDRGCPTKETFISYCEFVCIYKKGLLKKMKKRYEDEKTDHIFWDWEFDEDEFNKTWNIQNSNNIEEGFQGKINEDIKISNDKLIREFDKHNRDVSILNESGDVKFRTCAQALVQYYRCYVIDLDETLTLHEYFKTIRRVVEDETSRKLISGNENNCYYLYYDNTVPVVVEVQVTNDSKYFETTVFEEFKVVEEGD